MFMVSKLVKGAPQNTLTTWGFFDQQRRDSAFVGADRVSHLVAPQRHAERNPESF